MISNNPIANCRQTYGTARKSNTTNTRHHIDKPSKATDSLFPINMIAKLKWTQSNAQQNRTTTESHNGRKQLTTSQQQQNHRIRMDSSLSHWRGGGLKCILSVTSHINCIVARCLINIVYLMCLYQVIMTLHFLNGVITFTENL